MSQSVYTIAAVLLVALPGAAQTPANAPISKCSSAEHRQFDFWIGEWDVMQNGKVAGRNHIRSIRDGCAISEEWSGSGGFKGSSLNFYNRDTRRWHQTWIDSHGQSLSLDGQLEGNSMVLQSSGAAGAPRHKITWTPTDKAVRQLWQVQDPAGAEWKTLFDGQYARSTAK